jgi:hypothetical protein
MGIFIDGPESLEALPAEQVGYLLTYPSWPSLDALPPSNPLFELMLLVVHSQN